MFGIVWTYDENSEDGSIIACDKKLYKFSKIDYSESSTPSECTMVDFRIDGTFAKDMRLVTSRLH